ncbi:MAG TPA: hypothetical protein VGQ04_04565 [Chitinophagaceae bacterium]|jgi:hypothetical protein|nr:hypothetical protein [Chitinophagaceae bacterium]
MKRQLLILPIILLLLSPAFGQKRSWEIGVKLINEIEDRGTYAPGIGVQALYMITNHSGIESGFYYKLNPQYYMESYSLNNYKTKRFNEKVIQLPLLYRFESRLVNFTAGFALEYSINMKEFKKTLPAAYGDESLQRLTVVPTISISKSWYFSPSWGVEPELRASAPIPQGGVGIGINLSLRKIIF